jgi:hypothetical protein
MNFYKTLVWIFTAAWLFAFAVSFIAEVNGWWIFGFMLGWFISLALSRKDEKDANVRR